jgi:hypothetical protein
MEGGGRAGGAGDGDEFEGAGPGDPDTLTASAAVKIGPMLSHHQNAVLKKDVLECTDGNILLRCSDAESSPKRCFDRERD